MNEARVRLPLHGGCLCRTVRYRIEGAPLLVYACHCRDCQTRSGAAFTLPIVLRSNDFQVEGETAMMRDVTRSGRVVDRHLCAQCGVHLFAQAQATPDYLSLLAGTLDDASWVRPIVQVFVERAIPWAVIPAVGRLDWSEFDYLEQGLAWRATGPSFISG